MPNYQARAKVLVDVVVNRQGVRKILGNLDEQIKTNKQNVESLGFSYRKLAWTLVRTHIIIRTFYRAIDAGTIGIRRAIEAADKYKETVAGIAAVRTMYLSPLVKSASELATYYEIAKKAVGGFYDQLTLLSAYTPLTADQLSRLVFILEAYGQQVDLSTKKSKEGLISLANAIYLLTKGQNVEKQLLQEVRALMGDSNKQNAVLLQTLEALGLVTKEQIELWRQEGTLLENLGNRLRVFNLAGKDLYTTWRGLTTTFASKMAIVLRPAGLSLLERLKIVLEEIASRYIIVAENGIYLTEQGQILQRSIEGLGKGVITLTEALIKLGDSFLTVIDKIRSLASFLEKHPVLVRLLGLGAGVGMTAAGSPILGGLTLGATIASLPELFSVEKPKIPIGDISDVSTAIYGGATGLDLSDIIGGGETILKQFSENVDKAKEKLEKVPDSLKTIAQSFVVLDTGIRDTQTSLESFYNTFIKKSSKADEQLEELREKFKLNWEIVIQKWNELSKLYPTMIPQLVAKPGSDIQNYVRQHAENLAKDLDVLLNKIVEQRKSLEAKLKGASIEEQAKLERQIFLLKDRSIAILKLRESLLNLSEMESKLQQYAREYNLEKLTKAQEKINQMKEKLVLGIIPEEQRKLQQIEFQYEDYKKQIEDIVKQYGEQINKNEKLKQVVAEVTQLLDRWKQKQEEIIKQEALKKKLKEEQEILDKANQMKERLMLGIVPDEKKRLLQIEFQYKNYKKQIEDIVKQYGEQINKNEKLKQAITEITQLLDKWKEKQEEIVKLKEVTQNTFNFMEEFARQTAQHMQNAFSDFFFNFMVGKFRSLRDIATSFALSIQRIIADVMARWLAVQLFGKSFLQGKGAIGGAVGWIISHVFHEGGVVGLDYASTRKVPALAFAGAPKLHSGLGPDEFPAILKKGEAVVPLRGGRYIPVEMKKEEKSPNQINITNIVDPGLFLEFLASPEAENAILNIITRNNYKIKHTIGGL